MLNCLNKTRLISKTLIIKPYFGINSLSFGGVRRFHFGSVLTENFCSIIKLDDPELLKQDAFINNQWLNNFNSNELNRFQVTDPATDDVIGSVSDLNVNEAQLGIDAAHHAFHHSEWKEFTSKQRHDLLIKLYDLMSIHEKDLATILTLENGKPLADSINELRYASGFLQFFGEECVRMYGDIIPSPQPNTRYHVIRQPVGVAAIITPWNFPIAMITRKVGAALAAGCTVVIKPASETPLSCLAFAELCLRAGIPKGVVNVIPTNSFTKQIGQLLCSSEKVNKLSFTGSTEVGKLLMKDCASTVKKVSMELGGNAPFIVFDDADLEVAADALIAGKFRNAGQTCVCPNRIYVHSNIQTQFIDLLKSRMSNLKLGPGLNPKTKVGPLIHSKATSKVQDHVDNATSLGAKLLLGGKAQQINGKGHYFQPTLLVGCNDNMIPIKEETFGPIISIVEFQNEKEVIDMANNSEAGLAAYVFTKSLKRAHLISEKIQAGMIAINSGSVSTNCAPFGGVKQSGLGREGSKYGLDDYTNLKFISITL